MDQRRDQRDHEKHDHGQVVDVDSQGKGQRFGGQRVARDGGRLSAEQHPVEAPLPDERSLRRLVAGRGLARGVLPGMARFGRGVVLREDPLRLDQVVVDESDQAEQERQTDRPRGQIRIEPLQLADEEDFDCERGQRNQDGGCVKTNLPLHVVKSSVASELESRVLAVGRIAVPPASKTRSPSCLLDTPLPQRARPDRGRGGDREICHSSPPFARPWWPKARFAGH